MESAAFAYRWSAGQDLGPFVSPDAGTPFAIVIIAVDDSAAVEAKMIQH